MSSHESSPNAPAVPQEQEEFNFDLLRGHSRNDGSYKNDAELRIQYIQLTDNLIHDMTDGVEVTDPNTGEKEKRIPDVVIWLDKSARPVSWLAKELWPKMAPAPGSDEIPDMPKFKYLNIDRQQWINTVDPDGIGRVNVNLVDKSIIRSLRSVFVDTRYLKDGVTERIDEAPSELDDKTILVVDEVKGSGATLKIASDMIQRAFPTARIASKHWMSEVTSVNGTLMYRDEPVWYMAEDAKGRGVDNRNEKLSERSENRTQRFGAWFLSKRFMEPDQRSLRLRRELHELAQNPGVPVLPSFDRPDRKERISALNGGLPVQEVMAKVREAKKS